MATATVLGVTTISMLAACSAASGAHDDDSAAVTKAAQAFLDAQAEGSYAAALAATSTQETEFAGCPWMVADGRTGGIVDPAVGDVAVKGDSATAEVSYRSHGKVETSLSLHRDAGRWSGDLPDAYAITVHFDGPAVARLEIIDTGSGECAMDVADGTATLPAFPGTYAVKVIDPTGVVEYRDDAESSAVVHLTGAAAEQWDLGEPVGDAALASLQSELSATDADATLARVWTDDGASWQAEVTTAGQTRTGTLERDDDGALRLDLSSR